MKELKSFEFPATAGVGHAKYEWDKLLNGKIYELIEGEDFTCKASNFKMMCYTRAKKKGLAMRIGKTETGLVIQAVPRTADTVDESDEETPPATEPAKGKGGKKK